MRILFIGCGGTTYSALEPTTNNCLFYRDQALAAGLSKLGHDVDLVGQGSTFGGPTLIWWPDIVITSYDAVLLLPEFAIWNVQKLMRADQHAQLVSHRNIIMWADCWLPRGTDGGYFKVILSPTPNVMDVYKERYPHLVHGLLPFAVPSVDPFILPNPFPDVRKRAVYVGFISGPNDPEPWREMVLLQALARSGIEVWFGGYFNDAPICRGFSTEEWNRYGSGLRHLREVVEPYASDPLPFGSVRFGDQYPFYAHANVGIVFDREASMRGVFTSKVYDYFGCGLLIACENHVLDQFEISRLGIGQIFRRNDQQNFIDVVNHLIENENKKEIFTKARAFGTWDDRAKDLESYWKA